MAIILPASSARSASTADRARSLTSANPSPSGNRTSEEIARVLTAYVEILEDEDAAFRDLGEQGAVEAVIGELNR